MPRTFEQYQMASNIYLVHRFINLCKDHAEKHKGSILGSSIQGYILATSMPEMPEIDPDRRYKIIVIQDSITFEEICGLPDTPPASALEKRFAQFLSADTEHGPEGSCRVRHNDLSSYLAGRYRQLGTTAWIEFNKKELGKPHISIQTL